MMDLNTLSRAYLTENGTFDQIGHAGPMNAVDDIRKSLKAKSEM